MSHIDVYLYPSKFSKKYLKRYSKKKKKRKMRTMHMNNAPQKSSFICKNYVTKVVCMNSLSTQSAQSLNYFALCTLQQSESLTKTRKVQIKTVT